jgi:hypothetical protein
MDYKKKMTVFHMPGVDERQGETNKKQSTALQNDLSMKSAGVVGLQATTCSWAYFMDYGGPLVGVVSRQVTGQRRELGVWNSARYLAQMSIGRSDWSWVGHWAKMWPPCSRSLGVTVGRSLGNGVAPCSALYVPLYWAWTIVGYSLGLFVGRALDIVIDLYWHCSWKTAQG